MSWQKKVKRGSVTVLITQIEKGAKAGSYRVQGQEDGKHVVFGVYKKLEKAEDVAGEIALEKSQNDDLLFSLTSDQKTMMRRLCESSITPDELATYLNQYDKCKRVHLSQVLSEWFTHRTFRQDLSNSYISDLRFVQDGLNAAFGEQTAFSSLTARQIDRWLSNLKKKGSDETIGAKRFKNLRGVLTSIWKWSVQQGFATENIIDRIEIPKIKSRTGGHEVLTPDEYALMLHHVSEHFTPWLTISGFAGLRLSEICGVSGKMEDRLRWEDFDWQNKRIIVRPETSKSGKLPRYVPICEALEQWLEPWKKSRGFVHTGRQPSFSKNKDDISETGRLGSLIGGWRDNCLRASRASYRVAQTNDIGMTSIEDGHTEFTLKKNYLNPRFKEDAELWFSLTPDKVKQMVEEKIIQVG